MWPAGQLFRRISRLEYLGHLGHPRRSSVCFLTIGLLCSALHVEGQIPEKFTNLRFFPEEIPRGELIAQMREFSFALGVRCQYCHAGGDGVSFEGVEFHSDDDPDKVKARAMLEMTRKLNEELLIDIPSRDSPPVVIGCKTCHRGQSRPLLLTQEMRLALDAQGSSAAVARYRELRKEFATSGAFDFGEWEVNTLAEQLRREQRTEDAIAIYQLNAEFHPESTSIHMALGGLYETSGRVDAAREAYERVLELRPDHSGATERLAAITP